MRAVEFAAYGGPEVLELVSRDAPSCGPGEALIEVHAASVNPVDWKVRAGRIKGVPPAFPATSGRDGAGVVRAVGEGGPEELVGARVCFLAPRGTGTWADEIVLPAGTIAAMPGALTFTEAAALPLAGVSAWIGLVATGRADAGMRILVHGGAGGVGGMAVQLARHLGAHVMATCSARNVEYVRSLGAAEAIPYDQVPFETAVRDVDLVFDLIGGEVHRRSYPVLRRGGTLAYLNAEPVEDQGAAFGVEVRMAQVQPDRAALEAVIDLVAKGALRCPVERVLPLEAFAEAHAFSEHGHGRGKIVLKLR
jgi:NADPH:quinone reductase-like Zn-dependent oxidoreductase